MSRRHAPENPEYEPRWAALMAEVSPPAPLVYRPPTEPWLPIVYEDAQVVAADKPALLLSVPGKPADHGDCLEARTQARFPEARIAHRLDRPTSGLVLFGRGAAAHARLGQAFERREVEKTYVARVAGALAEEAGVVEAPICGDWPRRPRQMISFAHGKPSVTGWRVLAREEGPIGPVTRVALSPRTGRTHQLRVHMAWIGHPILGDEFYAPPAVRAAAERLQLHAERLILPHPRTGERLEIAAATPF